MSASDARPIPRRNTAFRVTFPIFDADGDLVSGAAGLDSEISIDAGTFADCTNEATEIATASGMYYLDLTAAEMNGDTVALIVKTSTSGAKTTPLVLYPEEVGDVRVDVAQISGDSAAADNLETMLDGTGGQTLSLGQLNIVATANNDAIVATGSGTGHGIKATGGATGDGLRAIGGGTSGDGIRASATSGDGLDVAGGTNGHGINAAGAGTGKDFNVSTIAAALGNRFADYIRRRTQANVEASSDGDALDLASLYGMIQQVQESAISGGTMTVKKSDGSTTLGTKAVTTDPAADPITGIG